MGATTENVPAAAVGCSVALTVVPLPRSRIARAPTGLVICTVATVAGARLPCVVVNAVAFATDRSASDTLPRECGPLNWNWSLGTVNQRFPSDVMMLLQ